MSQASNDEIAKTTKSTHDASEYDKIVENPLDNLLKVDKLYRGMLISSIILLCMLVLFYNTLGDDMKIHLIIMMVLNVLLIATVVYFYPHFKKASLSEDESDASKLEEKKEKNSEKKDK